MAAGIPAPQGSPSPLPKYSRQYFYVVSHQGFLFLSDAKHMNYVTAYKDPKFLDFFFKRLRINETSLYPEFPFMSPCGRELNFVRSEDTTPVVFTRLVAPSSEDEPMLQYGGTLVEPFDPSSLRLAASGRLYHPLSGRLAKMLSTGDASPLAGHGLIRDRLAMDLQVRVDDDGQAWVHWQGADVPIILADDFDVSVWGD